MYIYQTLTADQFVQAFDDMNRSDNFSFAARVALFDYLESLAEALGEPIELDVIALCCEFAEYTVDELKDQYASIYDPIRSDNDNEVDAEIEFLDVLPDHTVMISVETFHNDQRFIIQAF